MNVRTVADMNDTILRHLSSIPRSIDLVAGVPRSGLLAATLISLHLNLPLTDIQGLCEGRRFETGKRPLRTTASESEHAEEPHILVVDDCISKGTELTKVKKRLADAGIPGKFTYLAVYAFPERPGIADIVLEVVPRPMIFEWSFIHSATLQHACVDIDGVLCVDPTPEEDDDGERYRAFLRTAKPLMVPTRYVGALVTARLEKYRPETEAWLAEHGVQYGQLLMMDHPTAESRRGKQASFKAQAYRATEARIFVESDIRLAHNIAQLSGKPAIAFGTSTLYTPSLRGRLTIRKQRLAAKHGGTLWYRIIFRAPKKIVQALQSRFGGR